MGCLAPSFMPFTLMTSSNCFRTQPCEAVQLQLLMSYSAPILTYSVENLVTLQRSCQLMQVAYNAIFRRALGYRKTQSVSEVQRFFGYPNWETLCTERKSQFLGRLKTSKNSLIQVLLGH